MATHPTGPVGGKRGAPYGNRNAVGNRSRWHTPRIYHDDGSYTVIPRGVDEDAYRAAYAASLRRARSAAAPAEPSALPSSEPPRAPTPSERAAAAALLAALPPPPSPPVAAPAASGGPVQPAHHIEGDYWANKRYELMADDEGPPDA